MSALPFPVRLVAAVGLLIGAVACRDATSDQHAGQVAGPTSASDDGAVVVAVDDEDFTVAHEPTSVTGTNLAGVGLAEGEQLQLDILVVTGASTLWSFVRRVTYDGKSLVAGGLPRGLLRITGKSWRGIVDLTAGTGEPLALVLGQAQLRAAELLERMLGHAECTSLARTHRLDIAGVWEAGSLVAAIIRRDRTAVIDVGALARAFCRANEAALSSISEAEGILRVATSQRAAAAPRNIELALNGTFDLHSASQNQSLATVPQAINLLLSASADPSPSATAIARIFVFFDAVKKAVDNAQLVDANAIARNVDLVLPSALQASFARKDQGGQDIAAQVLSQTAPSPAVTPAEAPVPAPPAAAPPAPESVTPAGPAPPVAPAAEDPSPPSPPANPQVQEPPGSGEPPADPAPPTPAQPPSSPPSPPPQLPEEEPEIHVLAPNGGESWSLGSQQSVTWTKTSGIGAVSVVVSYDNGVSWHEIANNISGTSYLWQITESTWSNCLIEIRDADGVYDRSDASFAIPAPNFLTVTPAGGEVLTGGATTTVTWQTSGYGGLVDIKFSTNAGSSYSAVATGIANDGSEDVVVPNVETSHARVKVVSSTHAAYSVSSTAEFAIHASISGFDSMSDEELEGTPPFNLGRVNISASGSGNFVIGYIQSDNRDPAIKVYNNGVFGAVTSTDTSGTKTTIRDVVPVFLDSDHFTVSVTRPDDISYILKNQLPLAAWGTEHRTTDSAGHGASQPVGAGSNGLGVFSYQPAAPDSPVFATTIGNSGVAGLPVSIFGNLTSGAPKVCGSPQSDAPGILIAWATTTHLYATLYDGTAFSAVDSANFPGSTILSIDCAMDAHGNAVIALIRALSGGNRKHQVLTYTHGTVAPLSSPFDLFDDTWTDAREIFVRVTPDGTKAMVFAPFGEPLAKLMTERCEITLHVPACSSVKTPEQGWGTTSPTASGFNFVMAANGDSVATWTKHILPTPGQPDEGDLVQAVVFDWEDDTWSSVMAVSLNTISRYTLSDPGVAWDPVSGRYLFSWSAAYTSTPWKLFTRWYTK